MLMAKSERVQLAYSDYKVRNLVMMVCMMRVIFNVPSKSRSLETPQQKYCSSCPSAEGRERGFVAAENPRGNPCSREHWLIMLP